MRRFLGSGRSLASLCAALVGAFVLLVVAASPALAGDARDFVVHTRPEYSPEEIKLGALDGYFTGAVFAGDSLTNQLRQYAAYRRESDPTFLSDARFQSALNYSLYAASLLRPQKGRVSLTYRGADQSLLQAVERLQPVRLFVLLGANDYAPARAEDALSWYATLIDRVGQVSPDTDLVVQALPPVRPSFSTKTDYQALWDAFNEQLAALCRDKGVAFADIATPLKDAQGYLADAYSSDSQLHLSNAGLMVWIDALRVHAHERYLHNEWSP